MRVSRRWRMTGCVNRGPWRYVFVIFYIALLVITVRLMTRNPCDSEGDSTLTPVPENERSTTTQIATATEAVLRRVKVNWSHIRIPPLKAHGVGTSPDDSDSVKIYPYDHSVSQKISYSRNVPDTRPPRCGNMTYVQELPPVSLILTLDDEHISVILRALYGIYNRTPPKLLQEITLVIISAGRNTSSVKSEVLSNFPNITVMMSNPDHGVIGARNLAVQRSKASLLVFIHLPMEVNHNWLPPLLEPVVLNSNVLSSPVIDTVDRNTFTYWSKAESIQNRTGFNWRLEEQQFERSPAEKKSLHLPFMSPMIEFRAFVIHRSRLEELDGFNTNLDLRSRGHQIDFSVKVWLCGGQIVSVPCSRIGFIFKRLSITAEDSKNYQLLTERWFDDFGELFITGYQTKLTELTDRQSVTEMKEKLVCKPFRWYLEKVLPELISRHAPYKRSEKLGVIQSVQCRLCASVTKKEIEHLTRVLPLQNCSNPSTDLTNNAHLMADGRVELTVHDLCLTVTSRAGAVYERCSSLDRRQLWIYDNTSQTLQHLESKKYMRTSFSCQTAWFTDLSSREKKSKTNYNKWLIVNNKYDLLEPLNITITSKTTTTRKTTRKYRPRTYPRKKKRT